MAFSSSFLLFFQIYDGCDIVISTTFHVKSQPNQTLTPAHFICFWFHVTPLLAREQNLFIGLDSVPCAIAAIVLNIWHPGWCFPKTEQDETATAEKLAGGSSSDEER